MLILTNALLVGVASVLGAIPLLLTARLKRRLPALLDRASNDRYCPHATVILPCKGLDPGFRENVRSFLKQNYPSLELLFVVASADDPAYEALRAIVDEYLSEDPRFDVKILVAGVCAHRAQKLTNQLAAVRRSSERSKVLVFVDSDCRPDVEFVRRLVVPLDDPSVGVSTGYRWYHVPKPRLGSLLRSTWNAGAMPFLVDPARAFAWGGAMAVRRETFERAEIAQRWDRAVSDDMTLTVAVRAVGLEVRFVPRCVAISYEASTMAETVEFTNRQSLISRVYFPPLWWSTAIGHALANLLTFYGLLSAILWWYTGGIGFGVGSACLLLLPLQLINAAWLFGSVRQLLPRLAEELDPLRWRYILTAPLASLLAMLNTVHSIATRRMTWRGITYELRSPVETIVVTSALRP